MGLFDSIFGGGKDDRKAGAAGAGVTAGAAAKPSATVDPGREINVKFGTREPVPFKDSKTGVTVNARGHGNAVVTAADSSRYPSAEAISEKAGEAATNALMRYLQENSGSAEFVKLVSKQADIAAYIAEDLKKIGLNPIRVMIGTLNMDDESKRAYTEAEQKQMLEADPTMAQAYAVAQEAEKMRAAQKSQTAQTAQTAQAAQTTQAAEYRPKFCPNCGSPTGASGKFCTNCGSKL